jgi:glucokinase
MRVLAGDIGGTNTRLGVFELTYGRLDALSLRTFPSKEYDHLDVIVAEFIAQCDCDWDAACLAVAGPVDDGKVATTNLPWLVDSRALAQQLRLERVGLINDLEAIGHGIAQLARSDRVTLAAGEPEATGNVAIIAAGTGLGQAGCFWNGRELEPYATEGGHCDFAPRNELEIELLRHMMKKFARVSYERVLSGSGLFEVYVFLHRTGRGDEPASLTETIYQQAHPSAIVRAALDGRSRRCALALDLFVALYGAEAGNLALKAMARGGVYVAGGIAPRMVDWMRRRGFMDAFLDKGRMRPLLESMPVHVVMNGNVGLLGAARYAAAQATA